MFSVAFCDDNIEHLEKYERILNQFFIDKQIDYEIVKFKSGESLLFYLEDNPFRFDCFVLDILMDSFDGLKTATKIREINQQAKIIFLTTSNDYVFDSFDVEPSSYLVKNKDEEKLQTVLDKIILKKSIKQNDNFNFTHKSVYYSISNDDILFFEINHRVVTLHTIEGKAYEFYSSFVELDQRVNKKRFVKIYRSYIVNMQYIKQLSIDEVELKTGIKLPVSKKCFNELRKTFANFLNTEE